MQTQHSCADSQHCFCKHCDVIIYNCWTTPWHLDNPTFPIPSLQHQREEHTKATGHEHYTQPTFLRNGNPRDEE